MKKTIVALAVAAVAATSANAAVVYNQDGTKVDVGGSVRLKLEKLKDHRTDLRDNGSRVTFKASHDLGEGLSALGQLEIRFSKKDIGDSVSNSRLFAGFKYEDIGTLTFGKQLTNGDDVGVSDYTYLYGGVNQVVASGSKVIKFRSANFAGFSFGGDYIFGEADKAQPENNAYVLSAFYERKFGDFGFALDLGHSTANKGTAVNKYKEKALTVGTELSYSNFAVGVDYSQVKASNGQNVSYQVDHMGSSSILTTGFNKIQLIELGLKYQVTEKAKLYGEYIWGKGKFADANAPKLRVNTFVLGADYKIHKNVLTFIEGGRVKAKIDGQSGSGSVVGVGLRVFF
ncbi:porin [Pasteurella canis]|uniref:porin n=1 Tax=Pasteurella canis TaxID=753 RepID=UPI000D95C3F5|nr:porin [Pasteurella canis]SPY33428.1 major outer membrane protein OmpH-2 [Pasteurella canis]